ncbi:hypothetical protein AGR7C_Cc160261 [Agrobacterium deltaense Zutra 3/1]|uniref:Uncharacterized protein n=1 Tax=Agrobacterium deltaense Zutra 3/1 TaxID=1183427 RepID=A0A1S7PQ56_9HYPH|nr:hypothetical protein AGR7C_Cc160261 [Agrobacterium deltaense Zutra 3/1]
MSNICRRSTCRCEGLAGNEGFYRCAGSLLLPTRESAGLDHVHMRILSPSWAVTVRR